MEKLKIFYGILIGMVVAVLGVFLFLKFFTDNDFIQGIEMMKSTNSLGKLITLGCVLNICVFFLLLKLNQELMARGIILATLLVAIITIFV